MNKVALSIRMLELLYARGKMNRKQLAEELEITERKVLTLKEELEVAGYTIYSERGKNGGYYLDNRFFLPTMALSDKQKLALNQLAVYLKNKSDFPYEADIEDVLEKMQLISQTPYTPTSIIYNKAEIGDLFTHQIVNELERSIANSWRVKLSYIGLSSQHIKCYDVEPYWIIVHNNGYYLVGYEVNKRSFRMFKIIQQRLKKIEYTTTRFMKLEYKIEDILGKIGIVKYDLIEVEFIVYHQQARLLYEKTIGLNEQKKWLDDTSLYIKTTVEGTFEIKTLLMSIFDEIKIISPSFLKQEIIQSIKTALTKYEKGDSDD